MDQYHRFVDERRKRISAYAGDTALHQARVPFMLETIRAAYSYNFEWLSRPIIQYPQDIVAMQELIWSAKPDLIIETGVAHGGSLIFSASMLALLDYCDAQEHGVVLDPRRPCRRVIGIDIDIRPHNRAAIDSHPMASRIDMVQGSSIASNVVDEVRKRAGGCGRVLVCLDSNHTHDHVIAELEAYAPLTTPGSYCVVFDTVVEDLPADLIADRPWGKGNSPKTAVREYLRRLTDEGRSAVDGAPLRLQIDRQVEDKLLLTASPGGYLRRVA